MEESPECNIDFEVVLQCVCNFIKYLNYHVVLNCMHFGQAHTSCVYTVGPRKFTCTGKKLILLRFSQLHSFLSGVTHLRVISDVYTIYIKQRPYLFIFLK